MEFDAVGFEIEVALAPARPGCGYTAAARLTSAFRPASWLLVCVRARGTSSLERQTARQVTPPRQWVSLALAYSRGPH